MAAVSDNEHQFIFENQICSPLLKHIVDLGCAEAFRDAVCDSHKAETTLVLVGF